MKIQLKPLFVAALAIMIASPGCGQDGGPGDTPSTTATMSESPDGKSGGDEKDDDNGSGDGNGNDNKKTPPPDDELAWIPFGPGSPGGDQYEEYYSALQRRECSRVGSESPVVEDGYEVLYRGLGRACTVLFETDDVNLWQSAQQDLGRAIGLLDGQNLDCTEDAALTLAKQIRAFPDRPPKVELPAAGTTACEWGVETVVLADDESFPAGGPLGGGTQVKIVGTRLTGATMVSFGDHDVSVKESDVSPNAIYVVSPAADAPGFVRIKVVSPGGTRLSPERVGFTYVDDGVTQPSPSEPTEVPQ